MRIMTGVFRFVRHDDLIARLAAGWRWIADLGAVHGAWSSLMWWCDGSCRDCEHDGPTG
ncbi:hypothetical protein [Rhodoplanes sp. SY1]|uniref:hypothetical protein n=1 Tax=Rhodoplanes sp. SY1 TaxID=3166646 RepID=UPI0038B4894A